MSQDSTLPEICQVSLAEAMRPELFKAMSDPVRISIIAIMASRKGPSSVSDLVACCDIDFSGVSRHLKILRDADILSGKKQGRTMLYELKTDELVRTLNGLAEALKRCEAEVS